METSGISTTEVFCENSERLKAVGYFRKKSSIVDARLGSKYAYEFREVMQIFLFGFL